MQSLDFTGHTALVTGAASGIGRAAAELLAIAGARVVAADINQGAVACLAAELADCGLAVEPAALDVAEPESWRRLFAGPADGADLFVLNAGIAQAGDLAGTTLEDWREVFAVNCDGAFLGLSHAFAALRRAGRVASSSPAPPPRARPSPAPSPMPPPRRRWRAWCARPPRMARRTASPSTWWRRVA